MNKLIHAYVEPEGCWHMIRTVIWDNKQEDTYAPPIAALKFIDRWDVYEIHCSCGEVVLHGISFPNPDYSTPVHFEKLKDKLFGDYNLWYAFTFWAYTRKCTLPDKDAYYRWILLDWSRFCSLFCTFLRLPETIGEFGYTECEDSMVAYPHCVRSSCDCHGTGRILKPWARLAGEEGNV